MTSWAMVIPVLPGKTDDARKIADYMKSHANEYQESRRRAGITLERAYQMTTPMGEFVTAYMEGGDVAKAFETMQSSTLPIDKWFMEKTRELHGADIAPRHPPETLVEYIGDRGARKNGLAWCLPVLPGKLDEMRQFAKEQMGPRSNDLKESRRLKGITRSFAFLTHTPKGDFVAVYYEGDDVVNSLRKIAESSTPFDTWFRDGVRSFSGIDYGKLPAIKPIFDSLPILQPAGASARP